MINDTIQEENDQIFVPYEILEVETATEMESPVSKKKRREESNNENNDVLSSIIEEVFGQSISSQDVIFMEKKHEETRCQLCVIHKE